MPSQLQSASQSQSSSQQPPTASAYPRCAYVLHQLTHHSAVVHNKIKEYLDNRSQIDGEELPGLAKVSTLKDFNDWFTSSVIAKTSHAGFLVRRLQRESFSNLSQRRLRHPSY